MRLLLANLSQLLLLSHKRSHEDEESELQMKGEGEFDGEKEYKDVETYSTTLLALSSLLLRAHKVMASP